MIGCGFVGSASVFALIQQLLSYLQEPIADFCICDGELVEEVYAYCNLHGLWKC